ncbi:MAG: lipid II flippase MurJ, partial [Janthinobacterium sp.]
TLATPLIATLFHYGKFTAESVTMSTQPLVAYSLGLIGIILVKTLAPAFYARQDIRTPVKIAIGVLIATQLMNLLFVPYIAVAGLALSIGLGACLNATFLYWGLRKRGIYTPKPGWTKFFLRLLPALIVMGGVAAFGALRIDWIAMQAHPLLRAGALALLVSLCGVAYFATLFLVGFRFRDFKRHA